MIAVDTSSLIAYLDGSLGEDIEVLEQALTDRLIVLPPAVFAEMFSNPDLPRPVCRLLRDIPMLSIGVGYWERVGRLRATLFAQRRKARLADALIAQSCLDHAVGLITRDHDFRTFAQYTTLQLLG